jgi:hypothetical protein
MPEHQKQNAPIPGVVPAALGDRDQLLNFGKNQVFSVFHGFYTILLSKRRQSFPVDQIKKALRGSTWLFLSLFPLLHRCLAYAEDCGKDGLADLVGLPDAPDVLWLKGAKPGQTQRGNLAHGNFVHGSDLKQVLRHVMGNI